jgi:glycosyltransferase involved in cell wall biosynthesis
LGWEVSPFILGDLLPARWSARGSARVVSAVWPTRLAADALRLGLAFASPRWASRAVGQVDLVYERLGLFQALGGAFRRRGIPWLLEVNSLLWKEATGPRQSTALGRLAKRLELRAYRECDAIVAVSEQLKRTVVDEAGVPPAKVIVAPSGVDLEAFSPENRAPLRFFDGFTVGFVGRLYAWQGLDLILGALRGLRDERRVRLNLTIIGDGEQRSDLEQLTRSLDLADQVRFVGQVSPEQVPDFLAGIDVGYCSRPDGEQAGMYFSPLKLFEYMSMARPVLCADFAELARFVSEGETGFLFQPNDMQSLSQALLRAYQAESRLPAMGQRARQQATRDHSWTARVRDMLQQAEPLLSFPAALRTVAARDA